MNQLPAPQTPSHSIPPGVCVPWDDKKKEFSEIRGDESLVRRIWEENEALAYMYIWQVLESF